MKEFNEFCILMLDSCKYIKFNAPMLCVFSDASRDTFGACMYICQEKEDSAVQVRFVAAKSRGAPLKQLTIPRLELKAAILAPRLAKAIQEETRIRFDKVNYSTESAITLAWIHSPSRSFKPFVSVRVGEIQSNSGLSQWVYILGEYTYIADDVSKGVPVQELGGRCINGPKFSYLSEDK